MIIYNANDVEENWKLPPFCKNAVVSGALDSADKINGQSVNTSDNFTIPAWSVIVLEIKKPE